MFIQPQKWKLFLYTSFVVISYTFFLNTRKKDGNYFVLDDGKTSKILRVIAFRTRSTAKFMATNCCF